MTRNSFTRTENILVNLRKFTGGIALNTNFIDDRICPNVMYIFNFCMNCCTASFLSSSFPTIYTSKFVIISIALISGRSLIENPNQYAAMIQHTATIISPNMHTVSRAIGFNELSTHISHVLDEEL